MIDWDAIVLEHGPAVWRAAYRVLAHREDARECYQEVFLEAFRSSAKAPVRDWGAYLGTLAARRAIDRLRRRIRSREVDRASGPVPDPPAPDASPADRCEAEELMARVRLALAGLPPRQAEVFWLGGVEGLRHDRIAAQLGTSPGAVRMLLSRARAALAATLAGSPAPARTQR